MKMLFVGLHDSANYYWQYPWWISNLPTKVRSQVTNRGIMNFDLILTTKYRNTIITKT